MKTRQERKEGRREGGREGGRTHPVTGLGGDRQRQVGFLLLHGEDGGEALGGQHVLERLQLELGSGSIHQGEGLDVRGRD